MTAGVNPGRPCSLKNESAMASEVGITVASYTTGLEVKHDTGIKHLFGLHRLKRAKQ